MQFMALIVMFVNGNELFRKSVHTCRRKGIFFLIENMEIHLKVTKQNGFQLRIKKINLVPF